MRKFVPGKLSDIFFNTDEDCLRKKLFKRKKENLCTTSGMFPVED